MHDTNLIDALQGLLHFLFHTYIGVRLVMLAAVIAVVVFVSKQSVEIAKVLGYTLGIGGFLTILAAAWGFITSLNLVWIGLSVLGLIATLAGRGILDSYGKAPLQAAPQQQPMPTPQPVSPHQNVGNASASAINKKFGGAQQRGKYGNQRTAD